MRVFIYWIFLAFALVSVAKSAPISDSELKNLLAAIRRNRSTQADFHEQRVIRLMKNPVVSSGTVWFQPPNKFRREVKGSSPSVTVSELQVGGALPVRQGFAAGCHGGGDHPASQICPVRLCDQMKMVAHQNKTQNRRLKPLRRFAEQFEESIAIRLITENRLARVASRAWEIIA